MTDAIAFEARRCDHFIENDGTVVLMIKIDPADSRAFLAVSPDTGGTLFIAPGVRELPPLDPLSLTVNYRMSALKLFASGFFDCRDTWVAIGSDRKFLKWIKTQKCWLSGKPGHKCFGDVVPAHVRRVATGAGKNLKPKHSAIPLCFSAHDDQHQHGESRIGGRDRVDVALRRYLRKWASLTLLEQLGYQDWSHVPPGKLRTWALSVNLVHELPPVYRRASQ